MICLWLMSLGSSHFARHVLLPSTSFGAAQPSSARSHAVSDRALMKSTCWSVRVAYDFRFRIEAFDPMPFWAHLLPTAMAQFHTIFAMVVFSGGRRASRYIYCHVFVADDEMLSWNVC